MKHQSVLTILCLASLVSSAGAADGPPESIRLKNGNTLTGEILQYDDRGAAIRLPNGREMRYSSLEIDSVHQRKSGAERAAERSLAAKNFAAAADQLEKAVELEPRAWSKARLRALLVSASRLSGRWERSAEVFLQLASDRDDAEVLALAPLVWIPDNIPPPSVKDRARRLLADASNPIARLIGASWLLALGDRGPALEVLNQLQTSPEQRVAWMARAQAWRAQTEGADAGEVRRFHAQIEKMPPSLQGGPRYLYGLALAKQGSQGEAALAFLSTAYVVGREPDLIADSLLQAARASRAAGFADDAQKILREVVREYPGTSWGTTATTLLAQPADGAPITKGAPPVRAPR